MTTITTINATDLVTNSRADINTNFSNLNTDKIETSYLDTDTTLAANSDTKIPTQKAVKAYVDAGGTASVTALMVLPYIFPIGAIYTATVSTNPVSLLGFGTWVAFGSGRVVVGAGTGTIVATFASRASNVITVTGLTDAANNEFQTGQAVLYTAASGAMTGLTHNTTYYLVKTGNLTFSLATSVANANAGTVISLSSDGTGVQTFTLTLTTRTGGDTGGEENHALTDAEMPSHKHLWGTGTNDYPRGATTDTLVRAGTGTANDTSGAGSDTIHNNMQPFIVCYMWQRTA